MFYTFSLHVAIRNKICSQSISLFRRLHYPGKRFFVILSDAVTFSVTEAHFDLRIRIASLSRLQELLKTAIRPKRRFLRNCCFSRSFLLLGPYGWHLEEQPRDEQEERHPGRKTPESAS